MGKPILAWHFFRDDLLLRDGKAVVAGRVYEVEPPLMMCQHGLHASRKLLDALNYAPGSQLCRVRMSGEIITDTDKLVATRREVLWVRDATAMLHEFACWCAERALRAERKAGREPSAASWDAIAVKRKWLLGEASDDELASARWAAWDASAAGAASVPSAKWAASAACAARARWAACAACAAGAARAGWAAEYTTQNRKLQQMAKAITAN